MGEILKAAGCDYTNGEAPSGQLTALQPVYFLKSLRLPSSGEDDGAAGRHQRLQQRQRGVQDV